MFDVVAVVAAGKVKLLTRVPLEASRSTGLVMVAPALNEPLFAFAVKSFALPALKFQYA